MSTIIDAANGVQLIRTTTGNMYVYGTRLVNVPGSLRLWGNYSKAYREFARMAG